MRYDVVLFDLDGTLTASAPGIFGSVRHTMDQLGRPRPDDATLQKFVGPSMHDSMRRYFGMDAEEAQTAVSIYRAHYNEHGALDATVFTGVPSLLRALKDKGVYVAVASSKPMPMVKVVLEHFGLARYFDRAIGADVNNHASDKETVLRAALPTRYERAAMVGDRLFDMEAAKRLGLTAIGAGWGYGSEEELHAAGADAVAGSIEEAGRLLLGDAYAPPPGLFISIEGLDGSGKTTQMNAVADHLRARGFDVVTTREPGGTPISEEIRHLVLSPEKTVCARTEALLYAASRAQLVEDVIRPAVARGKVVLCDRFVDSSIAYQGAGRELGIDQVTAINQFAIGGTMPDLTLLLTVDAHTAFLRRNSATTLDRLERSGEAFFGRVWDGYAQLARTYPERIRCIDAQRGIEAVSKDACAQIDRLLAKR